MNDISISFGGTKALDGVSFDLNASEIHAIAGENGAGKSTLIKILAGIYEPLEGEIWLYGKQGMQNGIEGSKASGIVVIHQELNLVNSLSAIDNIFLGQELRTDWGLPDKPAMRQRAQEILKRLNFQPDSEVPVGRLRVGERQLVEIAKALAQNARVLVMDEPTSALSDSETESLYSVCRSLREQGLGIILITHRLSEMFLLSDRITVLRDGKKIGTWPTISIESPTKLVSLMIGKTFDGISTEKRQLDLLRYEPLLAVEKLTLCKAGRTIISNLSFEVARGEVFGVSGLLGAGKTEILESIFGITTLQKIAGRIRFEGVDVHFSEARQSVECGFAMVTEDRKSDGLLLDDSIEANFMLTNLGGLPTYPFYAVNYARRKTLEYCSTYNVRYKKIDQKTNTLSGGNQQKIIIGKWLLRKPKILLLDEPTRGIDTAAKAEIYKLIRTEIDKGLTVIIASSEIDELMLLCDRIIVMCDGQSTGILNRSEFSSDQLYRLSAAHI